MFFPFLRFRTSVEKTDRSARTTQLVSLVSHRKDIDVCAQQDLRATTVRMVTMLLLAYPCAHVNFYLAPTSLNIKHSEAEISIFTCASQHLKSPMFTEGVFSMNLPVLSRYVQLGLNANEIQIPYDKHHRVSPLVNGHQNTHNSVKYEVICHVK